MNDRFLEDPIEEEDVDSSMPDYKKLSDHFLTTRPLIINFINPDNEKPEDNTDCLLQIHLLGDAAGYYDDVFIIMTGGYRSKNKQWYYYDITGRYDLNSNDGEVTGWRYFEQ